MFVQQLVNGLSVGSVYALMAVGYALIYSLLNFTNFAHGISVTIGAFAAFFFLTYAMQNLLVGVIMGISTTVAVLFCVAVFFFVPTWLFNLLANAVPALNDQMIWRSAFEGILRIVLFLIYMALVTLNKDIKRVFQYHGAEHKTIFCYEHGLELNVENVRKQTRFHPRCGTSFIVLMLIVGILIGLFIPFTNVWLRSAVKILLLPVTVGIGYELIRVCGRHDNIITHIIAAPGMWMQHLTTKEPKDEMIEVAIASVEAVFNWRQYLMDEFGMTEDQIAEETAG